QRKAAEIVRCLRGPIRGGKERALVGFEKINPSGDVARVAHVAIKPKFCTQERCPELGNQFLRRVLVRAEAIAQIAIKPGLVPAPMRQLMESGAVELIGTLERLEGRHG